MLGTFCSWRKPKCVWFSARKIFTGFLLEDSRNSGSWERNSNIIVLHKCIQKFEMGWIWNIISSYCHIRTGRIAFLLEGNLREQICSYTKNKDLKYFPKRILTVYSMITKGKKKKKKCIIILWKYCSCGIFSKEILEIFTVHSIIYCLIRVSSSLLLPSVAVIHDEFIQHDEVI